MPELNEFYAVTKNGGLYHAKNEIAEKGFAYLKKIGSNNDGKIAIACAVGTMMENGTYLGITRSFIVLYDSSKKDKKGRPQDPGTVNMIHWGGVTSEIVALFICKEQAERCLKEKKLRNWDVRWHMETNETLDEIGDAHPIFIVSSGVIQSQKAAYLKQTTGFPHEYTARQLLAITCAKLAEKLNAEKIVLENPALALIASDSDWHRTREGFSKYKTAYVFEIKKKSAEKWVIAIGVVCGSYPADRYNCDIALVSLGNDATSNKEILNKIYHRLEKNSFFLHSLIYALADGNIGVEKDGVFGQNTLKAIGSNIKDFVAQMPEYQNDVIHLDMRRVCNKSVRYKPAFADFLSKKFYEIITAL